MPEYWQQPNTKEAVCLSIRETMEQWERENLSPYAALSCETKGRERWEQPCDIRPAYQRDRDRIVHCKSFRRLKHKTQVFLAPEGHPVDLTVADRFAAGQHLQRALAPDGQSAPALVQGQGKIRQNALLEVDCQQ